MMFSHASLSEQETVDESNDDTMLERVAETCVPRTAAVQSMAFGQVPVKTSKYLPCMTSMASRSACKVLGRLEVGGGAPFRPVGSS